MIIILLVLCIGICVGHFVTLLNYPSEYEELQDEDIIVNELQNTTEGMSTVIISEEFTKIEPDNKVFDTIDEMKRADLAEGVYVKTEGYYAKGDGGAAIYLITSSEQTQNNNTIIGLDNGLKAELQIQNNSVIAEVFGAYGDGIHDDSTVLQSIIDAGYNLNLTEGKTYKLISNGIYISRSVTINGNNATLLVDDTYSPKSTDFNNYCIRYQYGQAQEYFGINNLNIKVDFSDYMYTNRAYNVVSPLYIDVVELNELDITTNQSNNTINCVWLDRGCSEFTIKNSNLENNTCASAGGTLWITSQNDELFGKYNSIDKCIIENTNLFCSTADEVLGFWGTNNLNATVTNCKITGNIIAKGHTRPITIYSNGDNGAVFNIEFSDCDINAFCDVSGTESYYDSLIGVGSNYGSNKFNVYFNTCKINSVIYGSLLFPSGYASDTSMIETFDSNDPSVKIKFFNCSIDTNGPITGSSASYYSTGALYPSAAWNCSFDQCNVVCEKAFSYLDTSWSKDFFVPKFEIISSRIRINNSKDFICKSDMSNMVDLYMVNSQVIAYNVSNLISEFSNNQSILRTQQNAENVVNIFNSTLNDIMIDVNK